MDTLETLIDKINNITHKKPIFFVTNDPERALGLEKLVANYHIVCIDDNDIVDYIEKSNVNIYSLEKSLKKQNIIMRNSNRLLWQEDVQEYIKKNSKSNNEGFLMFFKIAPNLERSAHKMGFELLNTSSLLNRKFELKLSQYEVLKSVDIRMPPTVVSALKESDYDSLVKKLGENFIVQFNRGHTGGGTIEIDSKAQLFELKELFPNRSVRISKKIVGPAYTVNACATRHGICWGGLSYQITGIEECTAKKAGTVGNDWKYPEKLSTKALDDIGKYIGNIGAAMQKEGFRGLFGIDFVLSTQTDEINVIEINARQPASIPMHTKLQIENNQIPLNLLALAEFMNVDYKIDVQEYIENASKPIQASQLFLRSKYDRDAKVIGSVKVGTYRILGDNSAFDWSNGQPKQKENVIFTTEDRDMPLVFQNETYAVDGIDKAGILILAAKEGKTISSNNEVARIQVKDSLLDDNGKIKTIYMVMLRGLNYNIVLREVSI
ncbi:MAG: ATP-grasp domain-containing protein [Candidatus Dojkabacteria bacterium]|nr:ATP-grasp domain-containing protein [Candidatus Dojkabacteria bacterium]